MNITKYPQSCFILERNGKRIIIDPGNYVAEQYAATELPKVDGILLTHRHPDHTDPGLVEVLSQNGIVPIITNQDVAKLLGSHIVVTVMEDGEVLTLAGFTIKAYERAHMLLPDGDEGPQNTGYLIDSTFFHGGDTDNVEGISARVAAIPIAGPDMSPRKAFAMAKATSAQTIIPMHYDYFIADPKFFSLLSKRMTMPFEMIPLQSGETMSV